MALYDYTVMYPSYFNCSSPCSQDGGCSFIGGLTITLNVALSSTDWAAVQANLHLATEPSNTYLSVQAGFLTQGSNTPISSSAALQVLYIYHVVTHCCIPFTLVFTELLLTGDAFHILYSNRQLLCSLNSR